MQDVHPRSNCIGVPKGGECCILHEAPNPHGSSVGHYSPHGRNFQGLRVNISMEFSRQQIGLGISRERYIKFNCKTNSHAAAQCGLQHNANISKFACPLRLLHKTHQLQRRRNAQQSVGPFIGTQGTKSSPMVQAVRPTAALRTGKSQNTHWHRCDAVCDWQNFVQNAYTGSLPDLSVFLLCLL